MPLPESFKENRMLQGMQRLCLLNGRWGGGGGGAKWPEFVDKKPVRRSVNTRWQ